MGRKERVDIHVNLVVDMGLVFGKLLGRGGIFSLVDTPLKWVMVEG